MKNSSTWFGYLLFLGLLYAAITANSAIGMYIDYPTLLIIVGGSAAIVCISGTVFRVTKNKKQQQLVWVTLLTAIGITTLLGVAHGIVRMLIDLTEPNVIGPPMATAILSCFWGVLLMALLPIPLIDRYAKRLHNYREIIAARAVWFCIPLLLIFLVLLLFMLLLASLGFLTPP